VRNGTRAAKANSIRTAAIALSAASVAPRDGAIIFGDLIPKARGLTAAAARTERSSVLPRCASLSDTVREMSANFCRLGPQRNNVVGGRRLARDEIAPLLKKQPTLVLPCGQNVSSLDVVPDLMIQN
jgi:hypothetical protein